MTRYLNYKFQMIQEFTLSSHCNSQFVFSPLEGAAELLPPKTNKKKICKATKHLVWDKESFEFPIKYISKHVNVE